MHGNFVRRIGRRGNGPGELSGGYTVQVDHKKSTIRFESSVKIVIYDINGNLIADEKKDPLRMVMSSYYLNDSLYIVQNSYEQTNNGINQYNYFKIYDYSSGNCLDSLLIRKYESQPAYRASMGTIFQYREQVYMFGELYNEPCTLYVVENHQFVPFARLELKSTMQELNVTDRYVVAIHGKLIRDTPMPRIITPDMLPSLRQIPVKEDFTYYVYDYKTGKSINSYHGFIDDIHQSDEIVPIKFIDGGTMFFYTRQGEYSEELKTEPNPTLYIGTFKE